MDIGWFTLTGWLGDGLAATAAAYGLLALAATARGVRRRPADPGFAPAVTILKPLCGDEAELAACLRSFCVQHYAGPVQIVFGLQRETDPARAVAERLREDYPDLDITVVVDPHVPPGNRKVANLARMMRAAKHDVLVIADSDIRVAPDYLTRIVTPLADGSVGLVTCLYRGRPTAARWSRVSALFIDDWFAPSVYLSHLFGARDYAAGATLALRRDDLDRIGGFAALADHLADDHVLGQRIRAHGRSIVLSDVVVETVVDEPRLDGALAHEIRWMRTIRLLAPVGYALLFVTFTLPTALFGVMLTGAQPGSLGLLAVTVVASVAVHGIQNRRAGRNAGHGVWIWPLRECLTLYDWFNGLFNRSIRWRGQAYRVGPDGSMEPQSMDRQ